MRDVGMCVQTPLFKLFCLVVVVFLVVLSVVLCWNQRKLCYYHVV
jgi:hypothetical protein